MSLATTCMYARIESTRDGLRNFRCIELQTICVRFQRLLAGGKKLSNLPPGLTLHTYRRGVCKAVILVLDTIKMRRALAALAALLLLAAPAMALYSKKDGVLLLNGRTFDKIIMNSTGVAIVEFFAPWCVRSGCSDRLIRISMRWHQHCRGQLPAAVDLVWL